MHHWAVYPTLDAASKAASDFIAEHIKASIEMRGTCHVIVPGGNTPASCFAALAKMSLPWEKVHWYPGDERCYTVGHAERNDVMITKHLLSRLTQANFHRMPAEQGPQQAAEKYQEIIQGIDAFDIAFLGMGEDGHTASLFPGNSALQDTSSVVAVYDAPKPPPERVSMSIITLSQARVRVVLAAGASKAMIMERVRSGDDLPMNSIGDIHWFVDEACMAIGDSTN